ncbi:MAG: iron ABC transporter substrate-binding protein [Pseudonocardiaceae bacterium]
MLRGRNVLAMLGVGLLLALTGCGAGSGGSGSSAGSGPLTLYNGQHESTTKLLVSDFTKATGIKVNIRSGEDPEVANQILQEGSASPADVFYTENSPALALLSEKGKLAPVDQATLRQIPAKYDSPKGDWVGVAGREAVLVYNPATLPASQLPKSIMDVGGPAWHAKIGIAPAEGDFQAIVAAVAKAEGTQKATAWLQGLKRDGQTYESNTAIMQAVNRGDIPAGIIYHYYVLRDQAESGANSSHVKLYYFGHQDPGAFVSVSGAGVLKSSKHQAEAQRLVSFLTGTQGQTDLAKSDDFEYPLNPQVPANPKLKPFDQLQAPDIGPADIGDGTQAVALLQQVGLL